MTPREQSQKAAELFKERLKAARSQAGLTQDDLGAKAEISTVTLSKLETGVNKPAFEIFVALAHALGVSPNYLVGWENAGAKDADSHRRQLLNRLSLSAERLPNDWIEQLISISEKVADGKS